MKTIANSLPEYDVTLEMDGIGEVLGAKIISEIGDIRRLQIAGYAFVSLSLVPRRAIQVFDNPQIGYYNSGTRIRGTR